ncbi:hypothetical protein ZIOFF_025222 [Zingiber officinale]|uniref:Uncharacterized protein n=1 Tax=Zingiber officinale TaxID=94328 RepID=A0A8J5LGU4_ZINOF|nr:hypothetical protein ZIOFF_025222 [Zingiber officinale]
MDSNNSANSSEDLHGKEPIADEKIDKKKGRGASKLKMVSGQDKCKELERNEFGQPIGDNSVKYASFLGCMIKEFVSYTLDGWSDIDEEVKDRMWSCLQKKILECPPEFQNTTNIADDAISIVFGKEARGRVRGMDFGVTPSKVGASVQQNGMVQQLQTIVQNVQRQMQEMRHQNQL